jgi:hypothetical protein
MNPRDPRYSGILGMIAFTADQMQETGCTREEAQQRWNDFWDAELPGRAERRRVVERVAEQLGSSLAEANEALHWFETETSTAGQVLN